MELLQLLAKLGLPSAIVAMVIITVIFHKRFPKLSVIAGAISIFLATTLGIIQIGLYVTGSDIVIMTEPKKVYAITSKGKPTDLTIQIMREGNLLDSLILEKPNQNSYEGRLLSLFLTENKRDEKFAVKYEGNQLGVINFQALRNSGWHPSAETRESRDPLFWYTYKVFIGQKQFLGESEYGRLSIKLHKVSDKAEVGLQLEGHDDPIPNRISISSKGVGKQDFPGLPTFYIAVREANFKEGWAAFSIFTTR